VEDCGRWGIEVAGAFSLFFFLVGAYSDLGRDVSFSLGHDFVLVINVGCSDVDPVL
jgi:hypothetical protein